MDWEVGTLCASEERREESGYSYQTKLPENQAMKFEDIQPYTRNTNNWFWVSKDFRFPQILAREDLRKSVKVWLTYG